MSVWLCIPSARPIAEAEPVLKLWRDRGYRVALWRGETTNIIEEYQWIMDTRMFAQWGRYPGYGRAVNELVKIVMKADAAADWFVTGGDDVEPDANHTAEEIAAQCNAHFCDRVIDGRFPGLCESSYSGIVPVHPIQTFGVCQPTGDRFAGGSIDRICGSPWMGREFCRRMYQGNGPLFEGYRHMFVDEELQEVALKYGVLWQRPDLIHLHRHYQREDLTTQSDAVRREVPEHLKQWNTQEHWAEAKKLFNERKAEGFPGSEPIA